MEPSRTDQLQADLWMLLKASRRQESYLPLHELAELIGEALDPGEHFLLAEAILMYEQEHDTADVRS